ncbi:TPA: helix-turn-helix domain-containing protein [Pseudomonas aeruginosa]
MREKRETKLPEIHCKNCRSSKSCPLKYLPEAIVELLENGFAHNRRFRKGEYLFHQSFPAASIFIILSGALKTTLDTEEGEEIVTGFHFPNEILGLSGIGGGIYLTSARALETVYSCELAYSHLLNLPSKLPNMQAIFISLMNNEIRIYQNMLTITKKMTDARLASFLVNISQRNYGNGLSASQVHLSMTRQDIGNHLDMAVESVSRAFSRLQRNGLIVIHGKNIYIPSTNNLSHFAANERLSFFAGEL